jgi:predicted nucleotidyltransferase
MKQKNDIWIERFKKEALPVVLHECQPEKVVLFGSRVTGEANEESDLDVIVVAKVFEHIPFIRRMAFMLKKVRFTKHIDFLCYAPGEFERIQRTSAVLQDALQYGEVISPQSSLSYPDKVAESQEALSYGDTDDADLH